MMRQVILIVAMAWCMAFASGLAWAGQPGDVVEWSGSGAVNWTSGKVFADGVGVPPENSSYAAQRRALACRAAVVDAQRNLLETTQGVRVESKTLVKDYEVESDIIRTTVEGVVRGARVMDRQMDADGSCRVRMGFSLAGDLAASLYKHAYKGDAQQSSVDRARRLARLLMRQFTTLIPSAEAAPVPVQPNWKDEIIKINHRLDALERLIRLHPESAAEGASKGPPTGLIIDARGSNFIPSLAPRIRRIRGGVIYPDSRLQEDAKQNGRLISLFMNDLLLAQQHPRVGARPLVIKALRTWGKTRTELVLDNEAADRLSKLIKKGFLEHASVIVVLD